MLGHLENERSGVALGPVLMRTEVNGLSGERHLFKYIFLINEQCGLGGGGVV